MASHGSTDSVASLLTMPHHEGVFESGSHQGGNGQWFEQGSHGKHDTPGGQAAQAARATGPRGLTRRPMRHIATTASIDSSAAPFVAVARAASGSAAAASASPTSARARSRQQLSAVERRVGTSALHSLPVRQMLRPGGGLRIRASTERGTQRKLSSRASLRRGHD